MFCIIEYLQIHIMLWYYYNESADYARRIGVCEESISEIDLDLSKIDKILQILDVSSGMLSMDFGTYYD